MLADEGVVGSSHLMAFDDEEEPEAASEPEEAKEPEGGIVPGEQLVDEFGFVPHCAECGEPQYRVVGSGMCCPNEHGGCDSVPLEPEPEGTQEEEAPEEPEVDLDEALPGSVPVEAAENFLDEMPDLDPDQASKKEENPAIFGDDEALEDILGSFEDLD